MWLGPNLLYLEYITGVNHGRHFQFFQEEFAGGRNRGLHAMDFCLVYMCKHAGQDVFVLSHRM